DPEVKSALRSGGESPRAAPAPAPAPASARPSPSPQPRAAAIVPPAAPAARAAAPLAPPPPPPRAAAAPEPVDSGSIPKLLKETDVYVKYGLHDKATEHLRRILAADPDNVEAHEKAKEVAIAAGRTDDAVASLATLVKLYTQRRDPRAQQAQAQLREMDPRNAALAGGRPGGPEMGVQVEA